MATDIETQNTNLGRQDTFEEKAHVAGAEWESFRRVPDKLPKIALLILAVEVCILMLYGRASLTISKAG